MSVNVRGAARTWSEVARKRKSKAVVRKCIVAAVVVDLRLVAVGESKSLFDRDVSERVEDRVILSIAVERGRIGWYPMGCLLKIQALFDQRGRFFSFKTRQETTISTKKSSFYQDIPTHTILPR
jgi:hypothetical protein